jgi:hypothetical protein
MKRILAVTVLLAAIAIAGCSERGDAPKSYRADSQRPKTVVVNEGMSKEEGERLNERLADLEEKVKELGICLRQRTFVRPPEESWSDPLVWDRRQAV